MDIRGDAKSAIRWFFTSAWRWWCDLFDRLPDWMFVSEPAPEPRFPMRDELRRQADDADLNLTGQEFEKEYEREIAHVNMIYEQRKTFHDDTSKTVRRVFYTLIGTCLFCIITLTGKQDVELIKAGAEVKLPVLNYPMGLEAFLVVGPVVLISLAVYLHIFVGELRRDKLDDTSKQAMLPNFSGWAPRLVVLVIFYWMVPITLAVFTWKAWPRPIGPYLGYLTFSVATASVILQFRRCPKAWRGWALPILLAAYPAFHFALNEATSSRRLNLFKADLSKQDLRSINLFGADLRESNLSEANLSHANLSKADLFEADLSRANLSASILFAANLQRAHVEPAQLNSACLNTKTRLPIKMVVKELSDESFFCILAQTKSGDISKTASKAVLEFFNRQIQNMR